ncbi:MAG TPA: monovalent cation/H(+) antiporter subunit G [Steroidobacteraceae bacterium]|jgi:multicomponent Na+:H+ antiporter subunit G|nr:monovalent cation/H(+) antiporter subunit G [Steroidobacteraceae bacterium]
MSAAAIAAEAALVFAVAAAWVGVAAFARLRTPLARIHAVTFVNLTAGGAITLAAFLSEGLTSRTLKCALLWAAVMTIGALLSHASGRALMLRDGQRR